MARAVDVSACSPSSDDGRSLCASGHRSGAVFAASSRQTVPVGPTTGAENCTAPCAFPDGRACRASSRPARTGDSASQPASAQLPGGAECKKRALSSVRQIMAGEMRAWPRVANYIGVLELHSLLRKPLEVRSDHPVVAVAATVHNNGNRVSVRAGASKLSVDNQPSTWTPPFACAPRQEVPAQRVVHYDNAALALRLLGHADELMWW